MNTTKLNFKTKETYFKKVLAYSAGIILITITLNYILSIFFLDTFYIRRKEKILSNISTNISRMIVDEESFYTGELFDYIEDVKNTLGVDVKISTNFNNDGTGYLKRLGRNSPNSITNQLNPYTLGFSQVVHEVSRVRFLIYRSELPYNQKLTLISSLSVMDSHKHEFVFFNILTTLISISAAIVFSIIFSKKFIGDITKLNNAAKRISHMEFPSESEIIINKNDELGELSYSLYLMSKNLQASFDNLSLFVSNASHELKTPIAVIKSHSEFILKNHDLTKGELTKYHKIILKTSNEMEELVKNLLALTKISSPDFKLNLVQINLKDYINSSLEKYESLELQKDIEIIKDLEDYSVYLEKNLFQIVLNNLIENALKYSPENSEVFISLKDGIFSIKNYTTEKMTDNPKDLFKTFARGVNSYNFQGYGLGLPLVKKILLLHHIEYELKLENNSFQFDIFFGSYAYFN